MSNFDVYKVREDFPILKEKMAGKQLVYFDSSATSLRPSVVIEEIVNYYAKLSANSHRGDYELSHKVDVKYENVRKDTAKFINCDKNEVVFTAGTTEGVNLVARSFFESHLSTGDEIILNYAEHASNILPWYSLADRLGLKIVFCPLNEHNELTLENIKKVVTQNTKLIACAHVTNTVADTRDVVSICKYAKENGIYTMIDGAQAIPHKKVDVRELDCDFYVYSAHKMCGPTGIGVLYGRYELLEKMAPYNQGGGMNARFDNNLCVSYKNVPTVFEAGTQNIAGVLGMGAAINYLSNIGMDNINEYEKGLKKYALLKLKELPNIKIYNEHSENSVVIFNVYDGDERVFPQDVASYLNTFGIAVRVGDHCAKLLNNALDVRVTCRASFGFYNTKEEIDFFVDAVSKCNSQSALIL